MPAPETLPATAASVSEPFRELIESGIARGRNAMSIWQEMVDRHGFTGAPTKVSRASCANCVAPVRRKRARSSLLNRVKKRKLITEPAPRSAIPNTGKYRRARLFVLTLGYSRKCVRLLTFQSSTQIWAELHERAFRKLGGAVKIVVPDNLGEGVLKPDIYDATLNPLYHDVLAHYGAPWLYPAVSAIQDRKGKVESGVGHTQKTPLKGLD